MAAPLRRPRRLIGETVPLNGHPFTIVGVTPPGFQGTTILRSDAWVPMSAIGQASPRLGAGLLTSRGGGLAADGRPPEAGRDGGAGAARKLTSIGTALVREFPDDNRGKGLTAMASAVVPGHIDVFAGFLGLLMAIVGLVLLIACVNLSGMMLARAAGTPPRDRRAPGDRRVAVAARAAAADRNRAALPRRVRRRSPAGALVAVRC